MDTAAENMKMGDYRAAANRVYYAVFHAMRAVLALDEVDMSKHSGIIAEFRKRYLKTDIFDRRFSGIITQTFQVRNECDYDDFYLIVKRKICCPSLSWGVVKAVVITIDDKGC